MFYSRYFSISQIKSCLSHIVTFVIPAMCSPGTIELKEMSEIIETLYEMEGVSKVRHCPTHQLQRIFFMTFFSNGNRTFFLPKGQCWRKSGYDFR